MERNKKIRISLSIHFLCQSLFWGQILIPGRAYAASESTESSQASQYTDYDAVQEENKAQEEKAEESGGTASSCAEVKTAYEIYTEAQEEYNERAAEIKQKQQERLEELKAQTSSLANLEGASNIGTDSTDYEAQKQEIDDAGNAFDAAVRARDIAQGEYTAALAFCSSNLLLAPCSLPTSIGAQRLSQTRQNLQEANTNVESTKQTLERLENAQRRSLPNAESNANSEVSSRNSETNARNGDDISGCGITDSIEGYQNREYSVNEGNRNNTVCNEQGSLIDSDRELNNYANQTATELRNLAATRVNILKNLELEQSYNADYQLYELAITNSTTVTENGESQRSTAQEVSNLQSMALASSMVKNVVCEKHSISEVESQSFWLFKAASATWLTAVVNDTDYYQAQNSCMTNEAITSDLNNGQIQAIERAANLTEQQLIALCFKIRPRIPDTSAEDFNWRDYGATETQAMANIDILKGYTDREGNDHPPLYKRCDDYMKEILGDEYNEDYEMTREYALTMINSALAMAQEEYETKQEKLESAYQDLLRAQELLDKARENFDRSRIIMDILAFPLGIARYLCNKSIFGVRPFASFACPILRRLNRYLTYLTIVGTWYGGEVQAKKNRRDRKIEKLRKTKYTYHMACNFEDAKAQEEEYIALGEKYEDIRTNALNEANQEVLGSSAPTITSSEEEALTSADALNVSAASGNFAYFLTQKNQWFQNLTNDITNQPNHSVTETAISSASDGVKNVASEVILSVDDLAASAASIGEVPEKTLEDLDDLQKTGMATPETRILLIQNAYNLLSDNIGKLNGSIAQTASNLDQYTQLLNAARREMKIKDNGLGNVASNAQYKATNNCLSSTGGIDRNCNCAESGSCLSFSYPNFSSELPLALRKSSRASLSTANSIVGGNLSGAGVSGAELTKNAARVSSLIKEKDEKFQSKKSTSSLSLKNSTGLLSATEKRTSGSAKSSKNSSFSSIKNSLLKNGLATGSSSGRSLASTSSKKKGKGQGRGDSSNRKGGSSGLSGLFGGGKGNSSSSQKKGSALLGELQFDESQDKNSSSNSNENAFLENGGYPHHVRKISNSSSSKKKSDGIHNNREKNLFTIISNRYEKSAFPVFLRKKSHFR